MPSLIIRSFAMPHDKHKKWFKAYTNILSSQHSLNDDQKRRCQQYLLDYARFNANFSIQELDEYNYATSPFQKSEGHSYVRSNQSALAEILIHYYQNEKGLKPEGSHDLLPIGKKQFLTWAINRRTFVKNISRHVELRDMEQLAKGDCPPTSSNSVWIEIQDTPLTKETAAHETIDTIHTQLQKSNTTPVFFFVDQGSEESQQIVYLNVYLGHLPSENDDLPKKNKKRRQISSRVNQLLYNLGYLLDPISVIDGILRQFPKLFFDTQQTSAFLNDYSTYSQQAFIKLPACSANTDASAVIDFSQLTQQVDSIRQITISPYNIYSQYILHFIEQDFTDHPHQKLLQIFINDILEYSQLFYDSYQNGNLPQAIRACQHITELDLLTAQYDRMDIEQKIWENFNNKMPDYHIDTVLTPYALQAYDLTLSVIDQYLAEAKIGVTSQSYYEWLRRIQEINKADKTVCTLQSLDDVSENCDIIYTELHPNNVVEQTQFSHNIPALLQRWEQQPEKKRTLVVDITLNADQDDEINELIECARPLIESEHLSLMLVQSLTKFACGLDKRSAGILIVINKGTFWKSHDTATALKKEIHVSECTRYFFASCYPLVESYIQVIRQNVHYVYQQIVAHQRQLELLNNNHFQLTLSNDEGACYVALNLEGLLTVGDSAFQYNTTNIEGFSKRILQNFIQPLCSQIGAPISQRMSIGFGLSSINPVMGTLRLTIGTERQPQLHKYIDVFLFLTFIINRHRHLSTLLNNKDTLYRYLQEKKSQYMAMTPGYNTECHMNFSYVNQQFQLNCINGVVHLKQTTPDHRTSDRKVLVHPTSTTDAMDIMNDQTPHQIRKYMIACLSTVSHPVRREGPLPYSHVNLLTVLDNTSMVYRDLYMCSYDILQNTHKHIYGPYNVPQRELDVYIIIANKQLSLMSHSQQPTGSVCWEQSAQKHEPSALRFKLGNIPIDYLNTPHKNYLYWVRERDYQTTTLPAQDGNGCRTEWHRPFSHCISYNAPFFDFTVGERCYHQQGLSIYCQSIDTDNTRVDIATWLEKDMAISRKLRLILALFLQQIHSASFNAHNADFHSFLFACSLTKIKDTCQKLFSFKPLMELSNTKCKNTHVSSYSFTLGQPTPCWPSGISGISDIQAPNQLKSVVSGLHTQYATQYSDAS